MVDVVTAVGIATTAFNALKAGFEHGREIESMVDDISRWSNAAIDIRQSHNNEKARKGYLGSVESEALETFIHQQKIKEQEEILRVQINMRYGPESWNRVLVLQADIRKARLQAKQERERFQEEMIKWGVVCTLLIGAVYGLWAWTQYLIDRGV